VVTVVMLPVASKQLETVYYSMPDDGRITETCCGNDKGGEEELLR
jgi:hypothetical protein